MKPSYQLDKIKNPYQTVQVPLQKSVQAPRFFNFCVYQFLDLQRIQAMVSYCSPVVENKQQNPNWSQLLSFFLNTCLILYLCCDYQDDPASILILFTFENFNLTC